MTIEIKAALLGVAAAAGVLGATFGLAHTLQSKMAAGPRRAPAVQAISDNANPALAAEAKQGRSLFERNCAHCHGDDARGDEGPSLYGLAKSDTRIATIIRNGIKGEMPKFGAKFQDADIHALTAYLRTLKE